MKTIILYYSNHHGNTKKLVDAIQASDPENVEILDVTTAGPKDLSGYDLIGVASGIYAGNFGKPLLNYMSEIHSFHKRYEQGQSFLICQKSHRGEEVPGSGSV